MASRQSQKFATTSLFTTIFAQTTVPLALPSTKDVMLGGHSAGKSPSSLNLNSRRRRRYGRISITYSIRNQLEWGFQE